MESYMVFLSFWQCEILLRASMCFAGPNDVQVKNTIGPVRAITTPHLLFTYRTN